MLRVVLCFSLNGPSRVILLATVFLFTLIRCNALRLQKYQHLKEISLADVFGLYWPLLRLHWPVLGLYWPDMGLYWPVVGRSLPVLKLYWPVLGLYCDCISLFWDCSAQDYGCGSTDLGFVYALLVQSDSPTPDETRIVRTLKLLFSSGAVCTLMSQLFGGN